MVKANFVQPVARPDPLHDVLGPVSGIASTIGGVFSFSSTAKERLGA